MSAAPVRRSLVDEPENAGRTTATLLGSLTSRLGAIHMVSGADAIGSLVAGFVELGRAVSQTAEGARLRRALERGRPGLNGTLIWSKLRIDDWASTMTASPVLDQLRNDVALLLADDLEVALDLVPIPGELRGLREDDREPATFVDFMVGLWGFSRELVSTVDELAAPTLEAPGRFVQAAGVEEVDGELLR